MKGMKFYLSYILVGISFDLLELCQYKKSAAFEVADFLMSIAERLKSDIADIYFFGVSEVNHK